MYMLLFSVYYEILVDVLWEVNTRLLCCVDHFATWWDALKQYMIMWEYKNIITTLRVDFHMPPVYDLWTINISKVRNQEEICYYDNNTDCGCQFPRALSDQQQEFLFWHYSNADNLFSVQKSIKQFPKILGLFLPIQR